MQRDDRAQSWSQLLSRPMRPNSFLVACLLLAGFFGAALGVAMLGGIASAMLSEFAHIRLSSQFWVWYAGVGFVLSSLASILWVRAVLFRPAVREHAQPSCVPIGFVVAANDGGSVFATGQWDGVVHLWSLKARIRTHTFKDQGGPINCLAMSPDGESLACATSNRVLRVWRISDDAVAWEVRMEADWPELQVILFTPDGQAVVAGGEADEVKCTGEVLVLGTNDGHIRSRFRTGHIACQNWFSISPDSRQLAARHSDKMLGIWSLASGELQQTITVDDGPDVVAYSPDGDLLAIGEGNAVVLRRACSGALFRNLRGFNNHWVDVIDFSPDGTLLAFANCEEPVIQLWCVEDGRLLRTLPGYADSISFLGDREFVTSYDSNHKTIGGFRVWRVADGELLWHEPPPSP